MQSVSTEKLLSDLRAAVMDAEALIKPAADISEHQVVAAHVRVEESLRLARTQLQEVERQLKTQARALIEATDAYVRQNPLKSAGAAASSGVLVGLLLARR